MSGKPTEPELIDAAAADYMARRALAILIASAARTAGQSSLAADATTGPARETTRPLMRSVAHLVNIWLALRTLRSPSMLAGIAPRHDQVVDVSHESIGAQDSGIEKIDWQRTFARRASGHGGLVTSRSVFTSDQLLSSYIGKVVREIVMHADIVVARLRDGHADLTAPVRAMVSEVVTWRDEVAVLLQECPSTRDTPSLTSRVASAFARELDAPVSAPLFTSYLAETHQLIDGSRRSSLITDGYRRLRKWRTRYFLGEAWISPRAGTDIRTGQLDALYEIWCFAELINAANQLGHGDVSQHSFLRRRQPTATPDFSLTGDCYAYFDFHEGRFRAVAPKTLAKIGPALPRAHVEWLLWDRSEYRRSVVLDTKYYRSKSWDSREALKVLGYMMNFGVTNGAIVFPVSAARARGVERDTGLEKLECPDAMNSTLWVLTLVPAASAEHANQSVLRRFLDGTVLSKARSAVKETNRQPEE